MNTDPNLAQLILPEESKLNTFENFYSIKDVRHDLENLLNRLHEMDKENSKWEIARFRDKLNARDSNLVNLFYSEISSMAKSLEDIAEDYQDKEYSNIMDLYSAIKFIKYKHIYK